MIQPDPGLPAAGFVDGLALDSANALSVGKNQSGFVVNFTYLAPTTPGSLPFDVLDANFQLIASGGSTASVVTSSIPEPSAVLLWSLAIGLLFTRRGLNKVLDRSHGSTLRF